MENQFKKSFFVNDENVGEYVAKIAAWIKNSVDAAHRTGVVLGMSGGIDCSVVARLCQVAEVDVLLVLMPYGQDMARSKSHADAMALIDAHQIPYQIFDIQPAVDALTIVDTALLAGASASNQALSKANIRPRVRMTYLYQLAQLGGRFVVGTGNMAERTVGYFTKWGDGAADFNPLAMLTKQEVYTLARYLAVPDAIINKQPSAGLWEGQTDEEELGMRYAQIDAFILQGSSGDAAIDATIEARIALSAHKFAAVPIYEG